MTYRVIVQRLALADLDDAYTWAEIIIPTVLFLEQMRAKRLLDRRLSKERRKWWQAHRRLTHRIQSNRMK